MYQKYNNLTSHSWVHRIYGSHGNHGDHRDDYQRTM